MRRARRTDDTGGRSQFLRRRETRRSGPRRSPSFAIAFRALRPRPAAAADGGQRAIRRESTPKRCPRGRRRRPRLARQTPTPTVPLPTKSTTAPTPPSRRRCAAFGGRRQAGGLAGSRTARQRRQARRVVAQSGAEASGAGRQHSFDAGDASSLTYLARAQAAASWLRRARSLKVAIVEGLAAVRRVRRRGDPSRT